jgi:hypothetical protein
MIKHNKTNHIERGKTMTFLILLWLAIITIFQVYEQINNQKRIHEIKEQVLMLEWKIREIKNKK